MAVEAKRGCGYRKVGGIYLVTDSDGQPCDRLPLAITICPTCGHGIKQSRGWTWIDVAAFVGGVHPDCEDQFPCPLCMDTGNMGKVGLLWIGEKFYKTPRDFAREARQLGISRRIPAVPREFEAGKTWVMLAHPRAIECSSCTGTGVNAGERCAECDATGKVAGVFYIFRPQRLEVIVTESQTQDPDYMESLAKRGLVPVIVPDNDRDHQGSVYDKDEAEGIES